MPQVAGGHNTCRLDRLAQRPGDAARQQPCQHTPSRQHDQPQNRHHGFGLVHHRFSLYFGLRKPPFLGCDHFLDRLDIDIRRWRQFGLDDALQLRLRERLIRISPALDEIPADGVVGISLFKDTSQHGLACGAVDQACQFILQLAVDGALFIKLGQEERFIFGIVAFDKRDGPHRIAGYAAQPLLRQALPIRHLLHELHRTPYILQVHQACAGCERHQGQDQGKGHAQAGANLQVFNLHRFYS
ncbi:hypothetical protein D9M73_75210 [compost metagenome]